MRGRDIRFRRPIADTNHRQRFQIAVAIPHRNRSIETKFDLETYRVLATRDVWTDRRVECNSLPSENDAIRVLDRVNVVARTLVSTQIVPKAGDHAASVQNSL